ncbi:MAG: FAD-binding oxidoreductase [Candidatus Yanofskybacteria bacterium]|nr:FAD-binding oxidoreductase [Candidatus Yanofskybacteria bacterium]
MSLADDLRGLRCGDVDDTDATRAAFSHDASIFEVRPQVVVAPTSVEDIGALVRYATEHRGVSLVARGAGTDMSGGAVGESVILDMTRHLNRLLDVNRDEAVRGHDGSAIVQPGMYYRDFERATLARGLQYPVYPASRDLCTLGGMVANNSAGERTLRYGQAVDWVRQCRAVLADGNEYIFEPLDFGGVQYKMSRVGFEGDLYRAMWKLVTEHREFLERYHPRVSKNASGYNLWRVWDGTTFDLTKLMVGSQGTLGVVTQATLGLIRPPQYRRMVIAFLRDLPYLATVVEDLLAFEPESLESFDDKTLSFTVRFLPDFVRIMGASNIVSLGLQFLPEAWMTLTGGLPKLVLMAEFAGDVESEVAKRAEAALAALKSRNLKARMTSGPEESHKYWTIRRQAFNVIRHHTTGKRTVPFIDDIVVPVELVSEFLGKLYPLLEPYRLTLTIQGHAGNGNFHIIPLMDLAAPRTKEVIEELSEKVYDLVLEYHGSITAEHNDGLIRGPWVRKQFGPKMYDLFRQVKQLFDPKGIFNPGKKIDVDRAWALAHIRTD